MNATSGMTTAYCAVRQELHVKFYSWRDGEGLGGKPDFMHILFTSASLAHSTEISAQGLS